MISSYVDAAVEAAPQLAGSSGAQRRELLCAMADTIEHHRNNIIDVAAAETGLTGTRLNAELDRTAGQLRLLADHAAAGAHLPHRDSPGAGPAGADITQIVVPVGPVAVFAASNFPLAFGVAGGDTASALAAGCPVIVKAHSAQPHTSRLIASLIGAVLPPGFFALLQGGRPAAIALVTAPGIKAVGFTGSLQGGRALLDAANSRPDPIPVYAEMGSVNPVFVLPAAAQNLTLAQMLAAAVTGSSGQLCTKPGLIIVPATTQGDTFAATLAAHVTCAPTHRMLTDTMAAAHTEWVAHATASPAYQSLTGTGTPATLAIISHTPLPELLAEHFGPAVVVLCLPVPSYQSFASTLDGQLTATIHAAAADHPLAVTLLPTLAGKAGRIIWNGVPTGVTVCDAMHHGGPWPATSAPWSTSVGTAAINRFQRPVALQGLPPTVRLAARL